MFAITVILSLAAGITAQHWLPRTSAASDAQIRFAIENKYDSTGPGAKTPEYAYKTYQTLEEALVAYADDPDTQLPELEKSKALHKLSRPSYNSIPQVMPITRYLPKTVDEYTGYKTPLTRNNPFQIKNNPFQIKNNPFQEYAGYKPQNIIQPNNVLSDYTGWKSIQPIGNPKISINDNIYYKPRTIISEKTYPRQHNSYGFQDPAVINENSSAERHFPPSEAQQEFDPNPQYSFSYGVHDKGTGDSKSAHETRDGGTVRGFYTFMDADGKQRTVHYTADDKLGFRASVQRAHTNAQ